MARWKVLGLFVGTPHLLPNGQLSAIRKTAVKELRINLDSLDGDHVANLKYHGGDMRVIHHYSGENYNHLRFKFPDIEDRFQPGTFGENVYTEELTESQLNIGDVYRLGSAKVQLTVSRRPCATINHTYEDPRVLKEVMQTGRTGWYYRVLEAGSVKVGDWFEFLERPFPELPVSHLHEQGYGTEKFTDRAFLQRCWNTGLMDKGWAPKVRDALRST